MEPLEEVGQWRGVLGDMTCPGSFLYFLPVPLVRQDLKSSLATPSHHDDILPKPLGPTHHGLDSLKPWSTMNPSSLELIQYWVTALGMTINTQVVSQVEAEGWRQVSLASSGPGHGCC